MRWLKKIDINAPVTLGMAALSLLVLGGNALTGGWLNRFLAVYYTSFLDPLLYMRLLTHSIAHQDLAHYTGNFLLLLVVGPVVEERYGSRDTLMMIAIASVVIGLINVVLFSGTMLLGASGIVFMMILLASFVNIREGKFPLTVVLVFVLYIGNEIASLSANDQISQLSHILGGLCGGIFGLLTHWPKIKNSAGGSQP